LPYFKLEHMLFKIIVVIKFKTAQADLQDMP